MSTFPSNQALPPDPDEVDQNLEETQIRNFWIYSLFAVLQIVFFTLTVVWFLSHDSVFLTLFKLLRPEASATDVTNLMAWMGSQEETFTLFTMVQEGGRFSTRELAHYQDVRYWLNRLPFILIPVTFAWGVATMAICNFGHLSYKTAQIQFLKLWGFLLLVAAIWGLVHWDSLFSALHYPLFGATSWRLPADCYTLQLFPEWFWAVNAALVLVIPILISLLLLWITHKRQKSIVKYSQPKPLNTPIS